jgi:hypothetical protein
MDGHARKTKEGHTMRYMARVFAVLLVVGLLGVPALYAEDGGDYSEPPVVDNDTMMLADGGGDLGGQPVDEPLDEIRVAEDGGDRGGRPVDEADDMVRV